MMGAMPRIVPHVVPAGRMRRSQQPTLPAPGGLTLRPWLPSDGSIVVAAYGDPGIQQWHRSRIPTEDEARDLIAGWNEGWRAETYGSWVVVRAGIGAPARPHTRRHTPAVNRQTTVVNGHTTAGPPTP